MVKTVWSKCVIDIFVTIDLSAGRERLLYFHALASNFECTVPLRVLGNSSMWEANREAAREAFVVRLGRSYRSQVSKMN